MYLHSVAQYLCIFSIAAYFLSEESREMKFYNQNFIVP